MTVLDEAYSDEMKLLNKFVAQSAVWNVVLRNGNDWYDRYTKSARIVSCDERQTEQARLEDELRALGPTPRQLATSVFSRKSRNRQMGKLIVVIFLPAHRIVYTAEDREKTGLDLMHLADALAVHHTEHGSYPEKLMELVPGILEKPVDLFQQNPFVY